MFANDNLPLTDVVGVGTACPVGPHFYEFVSDSENRRRHWIGLVLAALLVHFAGCGDRTSSAKVILAPEDNTFVSYWQCAEGLANGLKQVESHEQFLQQPRGIVNDPKENAESIKDILDQL